MSCLSGRKKKKKKRIDWLAEGCCNKQRDAFRVSGKDCAR